MALQETQPGAVTTDSTTNNLQPTRYIKIGKDGSRTLMENGVEVRGVKIQTPGWVSIDSGKGNGGIDFIRR